MKILYISNFASLRKCISPNGRFRAGLCELRSSLSDDNSALNIARFTLGLCLWILDRRDEAEPHLQTVLTFFSTNPDRYQKKIDEIRELGF